MKRILECLCVLFAFVAGVCSPQLAHAAAAALRSESVPSGTIRGLVRDEAGKPVAGALVLPLPHGGHPAKTDASGKFEIPGPSEDRWISTLAVRDPDRNLAATVQLKDRGKPLDVVLTGAVTLAGRVIDPQGKPIAGAEVYPLIEKENGHKVGFGLTRWQRTNANGRFTIRALPLGSKYGVFAKSKGFGTDNNSVELTKQSGRVEVDPLILQPANLSVSGIVLDDRERPMAGVSVQASGGGQPSQRTTTDDGGRFTIHGTCEGRIELYALFKPDPNTTWSGGDEVRGGDAGVEIFIRKRWQSCMVPAKNPPEPLLGKALPNFAGLNLRLGPTTLDGKRVLICFWIFSHDESRDCIRQLAAWSKELAKKGVVIVGVQIRARNEAQLRRWLAKNDVGFPVSTLADERLQQPEQRVTYRFAVRNRVPWLILTDSDRVVRAEGFGLDALDKEIHKTDKPLAASKRPRASIAGRVTDAAGKPVGGALIEWGHYLDPAAKRQRTTTDTEGR